MIDQLRSLGIEKGKPLRLKQALAKGIGEAHAYLAAKYDSAPPPFFEGTHLTFPTHPELIKAGSEGFDNPDEYPVNWRGLTYTYG